MTARAPYRHPAPAPAPRTLKRYAVWSCRLLGHRYGEATVNLSACCPPPDAVTPTLFYTSHWPTILRAMAGAPGSHVSCKAIRRCVQCPHVDVQNLNTNTEAKSS